MARESMTLDALEQGKDAIIASVECGEASLRKHILDMGLTPGTEVTFVKCAPMGDPMEVRLRGYELTGYGSHSYGRCPVHLCARR